MFDSVLSFPNSGQKATIHRLTTMLSTSKNGLFPCHNHQYWWPFTLIIAQALSRVIIKVKGHELQRLAGGYDMEIGHF